MSEILRFKLNKKYRDPVSVEAQESIFCGRKNEINRLKDLIKHRQSATVLVSGTRGIGKTSYVRETLRQLNEGNDKKIVVDVSFANFNKQEHGGQIRECILKTLIRGFYFSVNKDSRPNNLIELYDKTYYSEFEETGSLETLGQIIKEEHKLSKSENSIKISIDDKVAKILISLVVGTPGFLAIFNLLSGIWILLGLIFIVAVIFALFKVDLGKIVTSEKGEDVTEKLEQKSTDSGTAKFDLSPDTLEIKLRHLLKEDYKDKKVVFIIDELDKISSSGKGDLKEHPIYKIISSLKNLFTLSNAIFVFITDDEFFDDLEKEKQNNPYSSSYTLFTDKIFLPSMYYKDVESLIDKFKDGDLLKGDEMLYKQFKSFVSWKAKNHVFDVHNLIEGYIEHKGDGESYVSVRTNEELKKGNIEDNWKVATALQVYLGSVYDNYAYPEDYRMNEKLYLALREVCGILYQNEEIKIEDNNYFGEGVISKETKTHLGIDELEKEKKDDFAGAIEDVLIRADNWELLDTSKKTEELEEDEKKKVITFSVIDDSYPDINKIKEVNKQLSYEKEFIEAFDDLSKIKDNLSDAGFKIFEDEYGKDYNRLKGNADRIKDEEKRRWRKGYVLGFTRRVQQIKDGLFDKVMSELISDFIVDGEKIRKFNINSGVIGQPLWQEDTKLAEFYKYVDENYDPETYKIIHKDKRYSLIGFNFDEDDQNKFLNIDHHDRQYAKSKVINLALPDTYNKKRQMKWSKVDVSPDFSNLKEVMQKIKSKLR